MEINIKTLTPLWTGGVEAGKCDRIHETGILGSLRWWMEVLVRGVGGNACDLTEQKCLYDPKKPSNGLCNVCQIFGSTGWKRRFRLEVQENQVSDASIQHPMKANRTYTDRKGNQRTPTWYFQNPPKSGYFTIQVRSLHPAFKPEIIGGLIQFIADWSALGARPQMGFGAIEIEPRIDMQPLYDWLITIPRSDSPRDYKDMPSLQNIFLANIQPKDPKFSFEEQDTFNLKYDLRKLFRTEENVERNEDKGKTSRPIKKSDRNKQAEEADLRHFIMGAVPDDKKGDNTEDKRTAAKVKISRPYENDKLMRVWGWIPEEADVYKNGWNREKVVDAIHQHLTANYTLHDWREMNSMRDEKTQNISDAKVFLRSLLPWPEDN